MFKFGKKSVDSGLVYGNFGNMSFVSSDRSFIFITKSGTFMDELNDKSVVSVYADESNKSQFSSQVYSEENLASSELPVHRLIYKKTDFNCVFHVHSPYSVAVSIIEYEKGNQFITPVDSEGKMFFDKIPIVSGPPGSLKLAENVSEALTTYSGVIAEGHGTFVAAENFSKAYVISSLIEHSAKVLYLYNLYKTAQNFKL